MKRRWIAALTAIIISATTVFTGEALTAQAALPVNESVMMYGAAAANGAEKDTDGDGVTDKGFEYKVHTTGVKITKYYGTATALTVPQRIEVAATGLMPAGTYDVTRVEDKAFAGNAGLTSVTMQGGTTGTGSGSSSTTAAVGLQEIGERAFYGCPALTTVTIPATVTDIGDQAFSDCPALTALNVTAGNQRYVSNDGVLYKYNGYNNTTTLGGYNTYTLLQYPSGKANANFSVPSTIANRLTSVGEGAFAGAQSLAGVTLPESVTSIGQDAFSNCSALTSMTIPGKVTVIPDNAFSGCTLLASVSIPDDVTSIGSAAFRNCYSLGQVTLPSKLKTIGDSAFYGCSALVDVTIPHGTTSMGEYAFAYCTSLVKMTIPATVTIIRTTAFSGTYGLTMYCHSGSQAAYHAANNKIGTVLTYTVTFVSDTGTQLSSQEVVYGSAAQAPSMPERPGYKLKWSCSFSNVVSDLTVTASYTRVYTVTFIDGYNNRTATKKVEYGKSATAPSWTMSGYTLKWSKSFNSVTGDMTTYASWKDPATGFVVNKDTIKPAATGTKLTKGTVTYRVTSSDVQNPKVCYESNSDTNATSVSIPSTVTIDKVKYKVTRVDTGAFQSNTKLKSLTIGSNVGAINSKAFYKCKNLSKVKIKSKRLSTIGSKAFYGIKNNAIFYAYRSKLKTYQSKIKKSGINTTIRLKAFS